MPFTIYGWIATGLDVIEFGTLIVLSYFYSRNVSNSRSCSEAMELRLRVLEEGYVPTLEQKVAQLEREVLGQKLDDNAGL